MKICYIITKADEIGGAQVHVRDLSIALRDKGHEILIITGEDGTLVTQLKENGINVIVDTDLRREINIKYDLKAFFSLRKIISENNPDLLALHSSKAGLIGRLIGRNLSIPTVFTVHGWAFADGVPYIKRKVYIEIEKLFAKFFTDKLITVSKQDKELALSYSVANENLMIAIQNGVSSSYLFNDNKLFSETKKLELIMVARFSEQKDHDTLFRALKLLKTDDWHLKLVGKGKLIDFYKELSIDLGIDENISFLGERRDVPELLKQSDVFLLISNWEGYPLSILEAMSFGLPVIASDVGGVSEAVKDNFNGYLIPRKNSKLLAKRLNLLLDDVEKLSYFSLNNKEDFLKHHTLDIMAEKTFSVYSDTILDKKYIELTPSSQV
jgi:glycosyltransferase involved in cell wall biosynthesis